MKRVSVKYWHVNMQYSLCSCIFLKKLKPFFTIKLKYHNLTITFPFWGWGGVGEVRKLG